MPIDFDLEKLRIEHNCSNYFETGLWDPRSEVSSKKALSCNFDNVFCIEIREQWIILGLEVFKKEIYNNRYHLIHDDSSNMKNYVKSNIFDKKTMFFLDAHVDNNNIHNFKKRCPLFDELNAIQSINRKDNVILIDDLRLITKPFPWGEDSYGNINFLQKIKETILNINPDYKFSFLNGHIENDVLLAYV
jgi:hypothetical protein